MAPIPVPMAPNVVTPLSAVPAAAPAAGAEKTYIVFGKAAGPVEAQNAFNEYAAKTTRGNPMKKAQTTDIAGMDVLNCFGVYKGDQECIRCPARKYCLEA
jgi:hypothetical protein